MEMWQLLNLEYGYEKRASGQTQHQDNLSILRDMGNNAFRQWRCRPSKCNNALWSL